MVGRRQKIKKKNSLKRPKTFHKKTQRNLDQNINDLKFRIYNSFFGNTISGKQLFHICPHVPVEISRVFLFDIF